MHEDSKLSRRIHARLRPGGNEIEPVNVGDHVDLLGNDPGSVGELPPPPDCLGDLARNGFSAAAFHRCRLGYRLLCAEEMHYRTAAVARSRPCGFRRHAYAPGIGNPLRLGDDGLGLRANSKLSHTASPSMNGYADSRYTSFHAIQSPDHQRSVRPLASPQSRGDGRRLPCC